MLDAWASRLRMFYDTGRARININLTNTSEGEVNVGTDISRGREALECLRMLRAATDELKNIGVRIRVIRGG